MIDYQYKESKHPITKEPIWLIEDINLAINGIIPLVEGFINKYKHDNYYLSIYDTNSSNLVNIECKLEEMPYIIEYVYQTEHASPLTFIGVTDVTESYVVGMTFAKGRIEFGDYVFKDRKLIKKAK